MVLGVGCFLAVGMIRQWVTLERLRLHSRAGAWAMVQYGVLTVVLTLFCGLMFGINASPQAGKVEIQCAFGEFNVQGFVNDVADFAVVAVDEAVGLDFAFVGVGDEVVAYAFGLIEHEFGVFIMAGAAWGDDFDDQFGGAGDASVLGCVADNQ